MICGSGRAACGILSGEGRLTFGEDVGFLSGVSYERMAEAWSCVHFSDYHRGH